MSCSQLTLVQSVMNTQFKSVICLYTLLIISTIVITNHDGPGIQHDVTKHVSMYIQMCSLSSLHALPVHIYTQQKEHNDSSDCLVKIRLLNSNVLSPIMSYMHLHAHYNHSLPECKSSAQTPFLGHVYGYHHRHANTDF